MRVINKSPLFLILSVISFYLSSFAIAFMPLTLSETEGNRQGLSNALAVTFWLGIILGFICMYKVTRQRKWDIRYKDPKKSPPYLLRFFSNKPAIVFDCMFIAGVIAIIYSISTRSFPSWVDWELLFITMFSMEMHCIFNGKNYKWLTAPINTVRK